MYGENSQNKMSGGECAGVNVRGGYPDSGSHAGLLTGLLCVAAMM